MNIAAQKLAFRCLMLSKLIRFAGHLSLRWQCPMCL